MKRIEAICKKKERLRKKQGEARFGVMVESIDGRGDDETGNGIALSGATGMAAVASRQEATELSC